MKINLFKQTRNRKHGHEKGFTLIHMIVVISIISILMSITVSAMVSLMNKNQSVSLHIQHGRSLNRFSIQFKEDIHQAKEVSFENKDDQSRLVVTNWKDEKTEYQSVNNSVLREHENKAGKQTRDSYRFMPGAKIEFSESSDPRLTEVVISAHSELFEDQHMPEGYLPRTEFRILARTGSDLRFQKTTK